jgi:hypothetical protein
MTNVWEKQIQGGEIDFGSQFQESIMAEGILEVGGGQREKKREEERNRREKVRMREEREKERESE